MADILIKDMEMPKYCDECKLAYDGKCLANRGRDVTLDNICPLKELQPHGRLIDADALMEDLKRQCKEVFRIDAVSPDDYWITRDTAYNQRLWQSWCEGFYEYLGSRPTVIPADGKDNDVPTREEKT